MSTETLQLAEDTYMERKMHVVPIFLLSLCKRKGAASATAVHDHKIWGGGGGLASLWLVLGGNSLTLTTHNCWLSWLMLHVVWLTVHASMSSTALPRLSGLLHPPQCWPPSRDHAILTCMLTCVIISNEQQHHVNFFCEVWVSEFERQFHGSI